MRVFDKPSLILDELREVIQTESRVTYSMDDLIGERTPGPSARQIKKSLLCGLGDPAVTFLFWTRMLGKINHKSRILEQSTGIL
jgi:hypothetical protein